MTQDDIDKIELTASEASKQKSLELLFDYTKFHIGLYLTLTASYVGVASLKFGEHLTLPLNRKLISPAVFCFMVAGLAGGVIASSITRTCARSSSQFLEEPIGPLGIKWLRFKARFWTGIEHIAFWAGLVLATLSALG